MSAVGKNIRETRAPMRFSQTDFANIFNLSRVSVRAYEEERTEHNLRWM